MTAPSAFRPVLGDERPVPGRSRAGEISYLLAAASVLAGASGALVTVGARRGASDLLVITGGLVAAAVVASAPRRALLGVLLVAVPLPLSGHLFYRHDAAEIGALGGVEVSITTVAVVGLYAIWLAESLVAGAPPPSLAGAGSFASYVLLSGLTLLIAADVQLAAFELALLVELLLILVYLVHHVRIADDLPFALGCLLSGAVVQSALMVAAALGLAVPLVRVDSLAGDADRVGGTIGSPNTAASVLAALLVLAASVALHPVVDWLRRLAVVTVAATTVALVLTLSRGGWLAATAGVACVVVFSARPGAHGRPGVLVGAGLALLVFLVVARGPVVGRLTADDGGSGESRLPLLELATDLVEQHPLTGVGLNNVGPAMQELIGPRHADVWLYTVHNKYLLVWAEAGTLAAVAWVAFLLGGLRRAARVARLGTTPSTRALAVGGGGVLVAMAIHMVFEPFQSRPQVYVLVVVAGLLGAAATRSIGGRAHDTVS